LECPLYANSGHPRNDLPKQKSRLAAAFPKSDGLRLLLPSGLNNWGFALADRSLAFPDTTSKAKGQYDRADYNQKFFHESPISMFYQNLFLSYARIKSSIESNLLCRFALSCDKNVTRISPAALRVLHRRLGTRR
jgi:hypothetical protein